MRTKGARKLSEADIQRTCEDILLWDGWRIFRIEKNFSEKKRKATGETGAPDSLCIRYLAMFRGAPETRRSIEATDADVLWIEWKAFKGNPTPGQADWHREERRRGGFTLIAGQDIPASIEGFREWYAQSGLQRRK